MITFNSWKIESHDSLQSAMQRMTANRRGLVFICNESDQLIGVLSDGDIRRAILNNVLITSPISQVMNTNPVYAESVEKAREILSQSGLLAIPVIDQGRKLAAIVVDENRQIQIYSPEIQNDEIPESTPGTSKSSNAIAIIPARGGSKRFPRKNLARLAGKPLVVHAVEAALHAKRLGDVIVSTDDPEIAAIAREAGASVPWLRPDYLAQDKTSTIQVLQHAMEWATQHIAPSPMICVLLEPTAPLRQPHHIDTAIEMLINSGADSVVSVCEVPHLFNPDELIVIQEGLLRPYTSSQTMDTRRLRGQQYPVYIQNGIVYATKTDLILEGYLYGKAALPYILDWDFFADIDIQDDMISAEHKLTHIKNK